jgi:ornithine cyclodeaminase/alanine dehydrogenase
VLILTRADVQQLIAIEPIIEAVEAAHAALSSGRASQTVEAPTVLPGGAAVMLPMAAALSAEPQFGTGADGAAIAGVKVLTDAPGNLAIGLSTQHSTITVIDPTTGLCRALIDGVEITRHRTAAASAVATRHLAREDVSTLGLIGAGALARTHLRALCAVRSFERVLVWSRSAAPVARFIADSAELGIPVTAAPSPEAVVRAADVLCTLTPSRDPLVHGAWFGPGLHVNAVGAPPRPDHREIDTEGIARSTVVVDDFAAATSRSGEICVPLARGELTAAHIRGELGGVILGTSAGRTDAQEITLFNSVGLAIQDLAAARQLLAAAEESGIGVQVDLDATLTSVSYTNF